MKTLYAVCSILLLWLMIACNDKDSAVPPAVATASFVSDAALSAASTPTLNAEVQQTTTAVASITPSITPLPSSTPIPSERMLAAQQAMFNGDYEEAAVQYANVVPQLVGDDQQLSEVQLQLAVAQLEQGDVVVAQQIFENMVRDFPERAEPHFWLAQLAGDCVAARPHYEAYLALEPLMEPYRGEWIAACYAQLGDANGAIANYEVALESDAHFLITYQNRLALANLYGQQNRFVDATNLYGVIRDAARTSYTRGVMGYFSAEALIATGDQAGGFAEYKRLIEEYPNLYTSYNALVELVQAGEPVDQFQRGLVDYYAEVYAPCVEAFDRYITENPTDFDPDALRYIAYCYEGLGNVGAALERLDALTVRTNSLNGLVEKGDLLRRQQRWPEAMAIYQQIADPPPTAVREPGAESADSAESTDSVQPDDASLLEDAPPPPLQDRETARPHALWWLARLHDWRGEAVQAEMRYRQLATDHPEFEHTPHALFRAGFLANGRGDQQKAIEQWREAALNYPHTQHGRAAFTWVLPLTPEDEALRELGMELRPVAVYYSLRIQHLLAQVPPFQQVTQFDFDLDQAAAEAHLRAFAGVGADVDIATLSAELRADLHLVRGQKLWQLRQWEMAKREFEYVREVNGRDVVASYQLALYFRDIGLYRSSIVAGNTIMNVMGENVFEAPKFIAGLSYPAYYRDLVLPLAEQYEFDPMLQFALLRQESLYESFATSSAVAQGLAQVIPDTGAYIAQVLAWPNYKNADLYKPHVGLAFGAFYLDEQLARFNEQAHAALAAYNGGPGNAANWYNVAGNDIDRYVETVTFRETRAYIERIYVGQTIYNYLYGVE